MVTYFNKKDMVSFGNYLLSDERKQKYKNTKEVEDGQRFPTWQERAKVVSHADMENWKHLRKTTPKKV